MRHSPPAFDAAVAHHQAGRLAEAERLYRQLLAAHPRNNHVLYLLAVLAHQANRAPEALQLSQRAIAIDPNIPDYHQFLGSLLLAQRDLDGAIKAFRRVMQLKPDDVQPLEALGTALYLKGDRWQAIEAWGQFVARHPDAAEVRNNLGTALRETGRLDEAIFEYRLAVAYRPDLAQTWMNLGHVFREKGDAANAVIAFRDAAARLPDEAEPFSQLGQALKDSGQFDDAILAFQQALRIRPDHPQTLAGLGGALYSTARTEEAIVCHDKLLATAADPRLAGSLLHALYFHPGYGPDRIRREHDEWNRRHAAHLAPASPEFPNDRDPNRRLRVGYVSPDFKLHASSLFTLPLLAHHDRAAAEVFCYADVAQPDDLTRLHQARCHAWRPIAGLSDEHVAAMVRADRIDVLVDLAVHTAGNRLLVFARKPAPVQVTWLGYPGTTGLSTMDYRLSDPLLEPPDADPRWYSEKTARLFSFWCYDPLADEPAVNALPAMDNGFVTFGCLNSFAKVSGPTLDLWRSILAELPDARLVLFAPAGASRARVLDRLNADLDRITFVDRAPRTGYLRGYHRIDIALDTWPYPGGTTTLDALWMGVPVVSMTGSTAMSRAGLSILGSAGLVTLAADRPEQYVRTAVRLARDTDRLVTLRAGLRDRLQASALMDAPAFAAGMEAAFREMWRAWCASL